MFPSHAMASNWKRRRTISIWLTIGLALSIATLTLVPLHVPTDVPGTDKAHHILAFAALVLPSTACYPKALFRVVLAAILYGALIEIIQPYVGRHGEFADFLSDVLGVGVGAAMGFVLRKIFMRRDANT
ncbi:VanZ family protein (plasmid) [Sulfitobacter sp. OXR-159]|uniref:VanZ family protein n=1 Tax=Sulfitobacter sp. OXR-159 TaxID=3100174 RepID=UPI002AC9C12E|nr:VanZ family protein [Sulfitobacter sp. OXR-159]WPZ31683.1 VanZ family protein [Sulfitobacter sp. OXR-159]